MKKLFVILLFLFLGMFVNQKSNAADFMYSMQEYRWQIRRNLGIDITNTAYISDSSLNQFVRYSIVSMNPLMRAYKTIDSFTTTYGETRYPLDTFVTDSIVGIIDVIWNSKDSIKSLVYMPKDQWYQLEVRHTLGKTGYELRPSYYDYIDNYLFVYPAPSVTGDTIVITAWSKIEDISTSDSTKGLDDIPQPYRTVILNYATYKIAQAKQHPMTELFKQDYLESLKFVNEALNGRRQVAQPTGQ